VQDERLTDFDLFQMGHRGWPSIATEVAQLNLHYARTSIVKPLVVGEIGYEKHWADNYENYQRAAFWLAMLNGAARFTYGNISIAEAYSPGKPPIHSIGPDGEEGRPMSPYSWEEALAFPGATQVAMGAKLLKSFAWWQMAPHLEWVRPGGTTLLTPSSTVDNFDVDLIAALYFPAPTRSGSRWKKVAWTTI
jgi:hypothetical protein